MDLLHFMVISTERLVKEQLFLIFLKILLIILLLVINIILSIFISKDTLTLIRTYLSTPYSTEAWTLLSMLASKLKEINPNMILEELIKNITLQPEVNFINKLNLIKFTLFTLKFNIAYM